MSARPLACTQCGQQCGVAEDYESYSDWGPAVIDEHGVVRPQSPDDSGGHKHDPRPIRARAYCPTCGYQWTLRRRVDINAP
ncbi:hypothetical protein ABT282_08505 [Streptomyces sp. NPDC000927]|uniref:hypothetical protein n=1 Tax=Streptomyces sp. NPDC000927 TaxID=3154371 RepID=UPI003317D1FF